MWQLSPNTSNLILRYVLGTSTHDGVAIAYATLKHFIDQIKPFTLFVTHYPMLAEFETIYPQCIWNYHMSFIDNENGSEQSTDIDSIVFLYKLKRGPAKKSYGLNVARLAGIPKSILLNASVKATEMEERLSVQR